MVKPMATFLPYIQIILSLLLIAGVLLQRSEASLGSAYGMDSASGSRFVRRGFEKTVFKATVLIAILFAASAFMSLYLAR